MPIIPEITPKKKKLLNLLLQSFVRGLLLTVPFALTFYIISLGIGWMDSFIPLKIPGLGMIIIIALITFFGYLGSTLFVRPIFDMLDQVITKIPLIGLIYSSLKELIEAFVGNKKKFNKPVIVLLSAQENIRKIGFITQESLAGMNLADEIAVYLPHSYNFSGNLFIFPKDRITILDISSTEVMKFVVSGGITGLKCLENKKPT